MLPNTKVCTVCGEEKSFSGFPKNIEFAGGFDPACKYCHRQIKRKNRDRRYSKRKRQELWELNDSPCIDCKQTFHPWQMQRDHVRGKKEIHVSSVSMSEERRNKELEKTELVCACCHAHRTYLRNNAERTEAGHQFLLPIAFTIDCIIEPPQPPPRPQLDLFTA